MIFSDETTKELIEKVCRVRLGFKDKRLFFFANDSALRILITAIIFYSKSLSEELTHKDLYNIYLKDSKTAIIDATKSILSVNDIPRKGYIIHLTDGDIFSYRVTKNEIMDVIRFQDYESINAFSFASLYEFMLLRPKKDAFDKKKAKEYLNNFREKNKDYYRVLKDTYRLLTD
ncbi:MAG: hypothetical protein H6687_02455 [Bacillales bacterium]|nr:hypothetical protein [Bacillales bacterium]